jgi:Cu-Zn family superoxide dismutase
MSGTARGRRLGAFLAGLALSSAFASSVLAGGAVVTRGEISAFATGIGLAITGHAQMVRTPDGRTFVTVHVEGLAPGATYASHVHKQACADGQADGHYRFDPAGAATPPNEIWPGPFTTNDAGIGNANTIAEGTAGPAAVSVVVHAPGGAKIACADLR